MATPYRAILPEISIGSTDVKCHIRKISLLPDQQYVDVSTFCNPGGQAPGTATWTCTMDVVQSFDTDGAWNILHALEGTSQEFTVYPGTGTTAAVTNPEATFDAYVPAIPFLDAEVGGTTVYTLTFPVIGTPVFATS